MGKIINNLYSLTCGRVQFINKLKFLLPYETGGGAKAQRYKGPEAQRLGGAVALSGLVRYTAERSVLVRAPTWEIMLFS